MISRVSALLPVLLSVSGLLRMMCGASVACQLHRVSDGKLARSLWCPDIQPLTAVQCDLKYIDPSYMIRAAPTITTDRILCKVRVPHRPRYPQHIRRPAGNCKDGARRQCMCRCSNNTASRRRMSLACYAPPLLLLLLPSGTTHMHACIRPDLAERPACP